jgi:hypothetical protein
LLRERRFYTKHVIHRRDEYDKRERWRGAAPLSITNQWVTGRGEKNDERQSQQEIAARV